MIIKNKIKLKRKEQDIFQRENDQDKRRKDLFSGVFADRYYILGKQERIISCQVRASAHFRHVKAHAIAWQ